MSIRGRPEDKIRNDIPGPGAYEPASNLTKDRVIAHRMDLNSQRTEIVTKEMLKMPGPGEYDSPIRIGYDAPTVTIRGRPDDKIKDLSPGPGKYDPSQHIVKDRVITYQMSKSSRADFLSKEEL